MSHFAKENRPNAGYTTILTGAGAKFWGMITRGKKVSSVEGNEECMEFFFLLSSRLQHRVLVHFFQVLLTWQNPLLLISFFFPLQWVEKVTAQMIPSSSPLTWLVVRDKKSGMYDRTPSPMQPLAFFIFAEKYRCENGWTTTPRFISFPLRAFWSMIFWRKRPKRKDEVHEFPVWNVHEAHGRSTAVGRNAPSRTQTIILQVVYCMTKFSCPIVLHDSVQDAISWPFEKTFGFCFTRFFVGQNRIFPWTNLKIRFSGIWLVFLWGCSCPGVQKVS